MDVFSLLIIGSVVMLVCLLLILVVFFLGELKKSRRFFRQLSEQYGGRVTLIPAGVVFPLERGLEVKIHALAGGVVYRSRIRLRDNPGAIVTRKYPALKFLEKLFFAPGHSQYEFHHPIDDHYRFQARNSRRLREFFPPDLLGKMRSQGRVTRVEIHRNKFRAAFLMISFSTREIDKAHHSIEILNDILRRVNQTW